MNYYRILGACGSRHSIGDIRQLTMYNVNLNNDIL